MIAGGDTRRVGTALPWREHAAALLSLARRAVERAAREGLRLEVALDDQPAALREPGASFVTLRTGRALRGCTGSLEAVDPLACDVARNGFRAAREDPRFAPLAPHELTGIDLHVSILSPLEALEVRSESELLASLRPRVDGLVLRDRDARSTFLPAVWESLDSPRAFLEELKRKAGLPADYWSPTIRFERYTVVEFGE